MKKLLLIGAAIAALTSTSPPLEHHGAALQGIAAKGAYDKIAEPSFDEILTATITAPIAEISSIAEIKQAGASTDTKTVAGVISFASQTIGIAVHNLGRATRAEMAQGGAPPAIAAAV